MSNWKINQERNINGSQRVGFHYILSEFYHFFFIKSHLFYLKLISFSLRLFSKFQHFSHSLQNNLNNYDSDDSTIKWSEMRNLNTNKVSYVLYLGINITSLIANNGWVIWNIQSFKLFKLFWSEWQQCLNIKYFGLMFFS